MKKTGKASEWKGRAEEASRAAAVDLELPSGQVIRARRPSVDQILAWDRLPTALLGALTGEGESKTLSIAEVAEHARFSRDLLVYCCVEPRVSLDPQGEDEIHPRDIPEQDWRFIVLWALRAPEARPLESFRTGREHAGAGGDGEDVRPAAGDAGGPERSRTLLSV